MADNKQLTEYKGMKLGDIITTYNNGFHRLNRIEEDTTTTGLMGKTTTEKRVMFFYNQVATNEGKLKNIRTELKCHSDFCKPAALGIQKWIEYFDNAKKQMEVFQRLVSLNAV